MKTIIKLPSFFIIDPLSNKPSLTIMFPYISFILVVISIILLFFDNNLLPFLSSSAVWTLSTIFYLIRKISKATLKYNESEILLEGHTNNEQ